MKSAHKVFHYNAKICHTSAMALSYLKLAKDLWSHQCTLWVSFVPRPTYKAIDSQHPETVA